MRTINNKPMYKINVDSAKISIPLSDCTDVSQDLITYYKTLLLDTSTGELIDKDGLEKRKPYILNTDFGTTYVIFINQQAPDNVFGAAKVDYIEILINSKHLGADYFKMISKETLPLLHKNIMDLDVFKCSLEVFSNARYTDTDIAFDFKCTLDKFNILKENILTSTIKPEYWHLPTNKDGKSEVTTSGIYASASQKLPRLNATNKAPYIKIYSKELDFKNKSYSFAERYNLKSKAVDLYRFEFTIKNREHKISLGLNKTKTFGELLDLSLQDIASQMFAKYFVKRKVLKSKSDYTPMEKKDIKLINLLIKKGANRNEIFKCFDLEDVSYNSNQALKEKYFKYMREDIIDKEHLEANELSKSIFEFLGVDTQTKLDLE